MYHDLFTLQTAAGNREDYKEITSELESTVDILKRFLETLPAEAVADSSAAFQLILK